MEKTFCKRQQVKEKKNKPLHENVEAKQKIKLIINELEEIRAIARR